MNNKISKTQSVRNFLLKLKNFDNRTFILSVVSFALNILFFLFNIIMAFISGTAWYSCLIVYYLILAAARYLILFKNISVSKQYKACGVLLIFLAFGLCAIIYQFVSGAKEYNYPAVIIYVIAVYTFGSIAGALISFAKSRNNSNSDAQILGSLKLVSAVVSYLSLQYIILETYSHNTDSTLFNVIAGGIVFLIVLSIAVFMLLKSARIKEE